MNKQNATLNVVQNKAMKFLSFDIKGNFCDVYKFYLNTIKICVIHPFQHTVGDTCWFISVWESDNDKSQILKLSKLQLETLSSYNTHNNQETFIFINVIKYETIYSHVNYIMTRRASSTLHVGNSF